MTISQRLVLRPRGHRAPMATITKVFCPTHQSLQEIELKRKHTSEYRLACGCTRSMPRPIRVVQGTEPTTLEERLQAARSDQHGTTIPTTTEVSDVEAES